MAATDVSDHMTRQLETEAEKLDTEEVRSKCYNIVELDV